MSTTGSFANRVYQVVRFIPSGQVRTYSEVAELAGSPRAFRAVGQLMKRNERSFLTTDPNEAIPCHRVVASKRKLGGFNAGPLEKRRLLQIEGWYIAHDRLMSKETDSTVESRQSKVGP